MSKIMIEYFDLCSNTCDRITQRYGNNIIAVDMPEAERTVMIVWTVAGIIENGGFRYLFSSTFPSDPDFSFTMAAFQNAGCQNVAKTIKEAICLFPNCDLPTENWKRIQYYEQQSDEIKHRLDTVFWNELDNITVCLAKYIKRNGI